MNIDPASTVRDAAKRIEAASRNGSFRPISEADCVCRLGLELAKVLPPEIIHFNARKDGIRRHRHELKGNLGFYDLVIGGRIAMGDRPWIQDPAAVAEIKAWGDWENPARGYAYDLYDDISRKLVPSAAGIKLMVSFEQAQAPAGVCGLGHDGCGYHSHRSWVPMAQWRRKLGVVAGATTVMTAVEAYARSQAVELVWVHLI